MAGVKIINLSELYRRFLEDHKDKLQARYGKQALEILKTLTPVREISLIDRQGFLAEKDGKLFFILEDKVYKLLEMDSLEELEIKRKSISENDKETLLLGLLAYSQLLPERKEHGCRKKPEKLLSKLQFQLVVLKTLIENQLAKEHEEEKVQRLKKLLEETSSLISEVITKIHEMEQVYELENRINKLIKEFVEILEL
jgi:hypothetical protein